MSKTNYAIAAFAITILNLLSASCAPEALSLSHHQEFNYPIARRTDTTDIYHGDIVADPYRWMENSNSSELTDWINAEETFTSKHLDGKLWDQVQARITALENYKIRNAPITEGGRRFYVTWPSIAADLAKIYVEDVHTGETKLLAQPPYHYGKSIDPQLVRFGGVLPSRTGRIAAYAAANDGSRWYQMRFVDVNTGALLPDELRGLHQIAGMGSWAPDKDKLFYVRFDVPSRGERLNAPIKNGKVFAHKLGDAQTEDRLIYDPGNEDIIPAVIASLDGSYAIVTTLDPKTQSNRVFVIENNRTGAAPLELFQGQKSIYTYLDNDGKHFWFYTTNGAPKGRIVKLDIGTGEIQTIIEEQAEAMSGGSFVGGNALGKFGDRFAILFVKDGVRFIRIFNLSGKKAAELPLPKGGSVWRGFVGRADDPVFYFGYLGLFDTNSVYKLDSLSGTYSAYSDSNPTGLNPQDYVITQTTYESFDGTVIPISIAHKKGLALNGENPAFLYGYGAFGWSSFLFYQSHVTAWLEMGGVYAQPALRGGGEFGEEWHDAGKGANKENTIGDYIAAAEWLVEHGYANPKKLVANGGSASSMPAAIAMQRRPDLFGAAIFDRPVLDMLRFSKYSQGRLWLNEFGSPENPKSYQALKKMSPYHTLSPEQCYPPTMVMTGEFDPSTAPMHGYKYVAQLQHTQPCDNIALLYLMRKAEHNFGSTPEQIIKSRTAMIVFLRKVLGEDAFPE